MKLNQSPKQASEIFRALALRKCALVEREGIRLKPFDLDSLPLFNALIPSIQWSVIQQLSETVDVFEEMVAESLSLKDNPQLIWRTLRRSGLTPPGDIFDKITSEDIVVVFAPDQRQIFRNIEFLRHSILTLEELYATEWYRYTKRDPGIVQKIKAVVSEIESGKHTGTFNPQIEEHVIEQTGLEGTAKLRIKINWVAPIKKAGKLVGIFVVERGWPVASGKSET